MREKVVVGMSGGVDSSVAALLLKQQGYEVTGVTMRTWQGCGTEQGDGYAGLPEAEDARRVAVQLGIPHHVADFRKQFRKHVMDHFIEEYRRGRTPNPCIVCNRYVKWEALLQYAAGIGAGYIATGHYARIIRCENGRYTVQTAAASGKDQTYALYGLTQEQLGHTLFPVGDHTKEEIRAYAGQAGLDVAHKPDSQEICFIPDHDHAGFIERETGGAEQPGEFVTKEGRVLGRHKGISHYTIGQRKGLQLALGRPVFVTEIRADTNEVVIGDKEELMVTELTAEHINYMAVLRFEPGQEMTAKIRYAHGGEHCVVTEVSGDGSRVGIRFRRPVRAVTPGQAVVFYEDGHVLGGGIICR